MIKNQTLKIRVPEGELRNYCILLQEQADKMNYQRLMDIEQRLAEVATINMSYICLQTPRLHFEDQYLTATIWLSVDDKEIEVRNITSNQRSFLTAEEYNSILTQFYKDVVLKTKLKGVRRLLSKPVFELKDVMGEKCSEALIRFSTVANKDSFIVNETDMELWAKFVRIAHMTHARISSEQLESWLIEDGWRDKYAEKLASYYEYSISLLKYV